MAPRPPRRGGGPPPRRAGQGPGGPPRFQQGARPAGRPGSKPAGRSGAPPRSDQGPRASGRPPAFRTSSGPRADSPSRAGERLNKVLAAAGLGSRRAVEELILQGRVTVDGQVVRDLATKVDPGSAAIAVDGERIRREKTVYLAVYKPKGFITSNADPAGRPRVIDLVPGLPQRVYPIGRLDEDSTGLILLTNDGELANRLAHPKFGVEKVYRVLVAGKPGPEVLDKLVEGVWLAEGKARARAARFVNEKSHHGEATMIELTLAEGKNREVRRMLAKLGHKVMRLTRISVGPVTLKGLSAGQWRHLEPGEVALLRRVADGEAMPSRGPKRREPSPRRSRAIGGPCPAPSGPRGGLGHLVGSADAPRRGGRPVVVPGAGRERDQGRGGQGRRPGGVPRRGAVGSFAPPPSGPQGRRPSRDGDDGPDEILVAPIGVGGDSPPPSRGRRPGGPPPRRPAGPGRGRGRGLGSGNAGGPRSRRVIGLGAAPVIGDDGPPPRRRSAGPGGSKPPGGPVRRRPKPLPKARRSKPSDDE
ncbi:pseudouridine synthase [Tautonia sociabilis]|uniref:Pseudouridine synthase n=1 Tax=Tautonia sociabilis TaxID=2080755 RepID=A0A432MLX1_9BACT|nr:pseudouridine synthase [Tautonia sociabilis]RUL88088.1 rRNA pseudouridine synthase [Tautonia sociabilis]